MSHVFQLSNEQYEKIAAYAEQQEQTPEELFQVWVDEVIHQIETTSISESEEQMDDEELLANHPLLQIEGILSIGEPGWADKHDEYLAEAYADDHAEE